MQLRLQPALVKTVTEESSRYAAKTLPIQLYHQQAQGGFPVLLPKRNFFVIFASVEVEDGLLRPHLLHRLGARSSALQLSKLKRANPSRSRETASVRSWAVHSIMIASWRLPPPSQRRLAGMPPETSPRKDRAVAMVAENQITTSKRGKQRFMTGYLKRATRLSVRSRC